LFKKKLLSDKFIGHWYEEEPHRGQGFRALLVENNIIDDLLISAGLQSGVKDFETRIKRGWTLWIDPGEVEARDEVTGRNTVVYKEKKEINNNNNNNNNNGGEKFSISPREMMINKNNNNNTGRKSPTRLGRLSPTFKSQGQYINNNMYVNNNNNNNNIEHYNNTTATNNFEPQDYYADYRPRWHNTNNTNNIKNYTNGGWHSQDYELAYYDYSPSVHTMNNNNNYQQHRHNGFVNYFDTNKSFGNNGNTIITTPKDDLDQNECIDSLEYYPVSRNIASRA